MNPTTPPRAHAQLSVEGVIRQCPDDFSVDEQAADMPTAAGDHLLIRVEKRGLNTNDVAEELARVFGVAPVDIGFAGMKDRHAVTRQWFSVRTACDASNIATGTEGWRVIESARRQHKLRRGDLAGNSFRIRIRQLRGDLDAVSERLAVIRRSGVPNYFGEQRFGRDGANVERAKAWINKRPRPVVPAFQKGLHLSTARSLLFNAVLALRVERGCWNTPVDGDVLIDARPTGPLWGRGQALATGTARAIEIDALAPYHEWLDPLEHLGLTQERRVFVLNPARFDWSFDGDNLVVSFDLAPGQYATALLRELGSLRNAAPGAAS